MRIGSLFSGIGGLELGLERAGVGRTIWQVEIDPFCRFVLAQHWPEAQRYHDIRTARHLPAVDVVCGGFPCQDISVAGNGVGIDGEQSGLWREFARIVEDIRPRFVVVENVSALVARGLDRVVGDLEWLGYRVEGRLIRASDVGAPHRRERIFLVADADGAGQRAQRIRSTEDEDASQRNDVDGRGGPHDGTRRSRAALARDDDARRPPKRRLGRDADGVPAGVDRWPATPGSTQFAFEPPRTVGAGNDDLRSDRLRALGNAVIPACGYVAGRRVMELAREAA